MAMKLNYILLGKRIKSLRKQHLLTQKDLASLCGFSHGHLSKIENGHTIPSLNTIVNLANVFQISVECLLGGHHFEFLDKNDPKWDMLGRWLATDTAQCTQSMLRLHWDAEP